MTAEFEQTSFLFGANAEFIFGMYSRYLKDPSSVDPSWARFFADLKDEAPTVLKELEGASWAPANGAPLTTTVPEVGAGPPVAPSPRAEIRDVRAETIDSIRALMLIRAYRVRGHLIANFDPLGIERGVHHPELDPKTYGFDEDDYDREIFIDGVLGLEKASLRDILVILRETYCGSIGVEYMHIQEPDQKAWIQERIEQIRNQTQFTLQGKRAILERLIAAEVFEKFLDRKYVGTKRFGLEGGEALVPAMEQVLKRGGQLGIQEIVLGMAHRGRLNLLANVLAKPFSAIFSEFQGASAHPEDVQGSGDVKYHLGTSADRDFDGNVIHLSLTANPSHLEAVNPVVVGKTRAKQTRRGDRDRNEVMAMLLHGDAAFAGQGLVAETFDLSDLKGYRTGGTVHFIINNQIGFTTSPSYSRSSPYPSDVAKMVQAPIFHVNGDDPEAVVHVARIATEFRQKFKRDVVVDMFCYRRHGHNEADEPGFTQPKMYSVIAKHPTTRQLYAERLIEEGVVGEEDVEALTRDFRDRLEQAFEAAKSYKPNKADWLEGAWRGFEKATGEERRGRTSVPLETLREVGLALSQVPEDFNVNRKIARQLDARRRMIEAGEGIDWATAEALAFGTLLCEDTPVRLSGQDSGRGTFSQRHAILVDQETEERYMPLAHIRSDQALVEIIDSPLSEVAVLGFEYGYSLAEPRALVMWEAQFGDFANGAQVIIDQFISSSESKWLRMSGLTLLLPHGYEGQGPEHSSARLERYLQLCAEDNLQVANCTTPANYFHILRRQVRRNFRKPLVLMTPKSLLRHKRCVSRLEEMGPESSFHRILWDDAEMGERWLVPDDRIRRVVLCCGKLYYDLLAEREKRDLRDVYLLRVEQLYPFPIRSLTRELKRFPNAEVIWAQEEPRNMGAWQFIDRRIEQVLKDIGYGGAWPAYVGRPDSASTATGLLSRHLEEQKALVDAALTIG